MSAGGWVRASPAAVYEPAEDTAAPALAGSAAWLFTSNLLYSVCQWATVVALAKLGTPAPLGHLGLALAVATPVVLVTGFALRSYQATDVLGRYTFADYLGLRLAANVVAAVVIATAATWARLETAAVAILVPITTAKLAEATSETCYGLAQRHERMRLVALSRMTRGAAGMAALVGVVSLGGSLAAGAWALAAAWTAFLAAVDLPVASLLEPIRRPPSLAALGRLARETAPLGAVNGLYAFGQSLPRYLLEASHGAAAVGYFTALSAVVPALNQLAAAVGHAAAPRLGWAAALDPGRYRALVLRLLGAAGLVCVVLVAGAAGFGRAFLRIAYADDYAAYGLTFVLVVLAGGLGVVNEVFYVAFLAARRLRLQLVLQGLALAVTWLTASLLVGPFGIGGAAGAAACGAAVAALAATVLVLRARRTT